MNMWAACVLALGAGACNVVPSVAVTPRFGPLEIDGELGASSGAAVATSSAEALGLGEDTGVLAPRFDASWLAFDGWASYLDARFAGTGTAEGQLDLGGVVIAAGDPTVSEIDILLGTSGLTYDLVPGDMVDLGIGIGFAYVDLDASVTSQTTSQTVRAAEVFTLPLVAARAAVSAGDFELSIVAAGLSIEIDGDELEVFDADAMLRWTFLDAGPAQGGIVIGYRMSDVAARYDDGASTVDADLGLDGPYAGISIEL
jgi:hypothetical protein